MRLNIIDEICDYVRFLNSTYGFEITIHPLGWDDYLLHTRIVECNAHKNLFCHQIKIHSDEQNNFCFQEQHNCFKRCNSNDAFFYTCFAGITQLIFPLYNKNAKIGYLSVGNFYTDKNESLKILYAHCKKYNIDTDVMNPFFESCVKELNHSKSFIATLVNPILSMVEIAYLQAEKIPTYDDDNSFYLRLISYISTSYTSNITIEYLAKRSNCSVSYLSHFFKKQCGMSMPEYINFLRIKDAKNYLEMSNMSIQEIAYSLGYSSSNYFSTVFKKQLGVSPKEYKENLKSE